VNNWPDIIALLSEFFENDEDDITLWLVTSNHMLGNQMPIYMIIAGRSQKLLDFMKVQFEEGKR